MQQFVFSPLNVSNNIRTKFNVTCLCPPRDNHGSSLIYAPTIFCSRICIHAFGTLSFFYQHNVISELNVTSECRTGSSFNEMESVPNNTTSLPSRQYSDKYQTILNMLICGGTIVTQPSSFWWKLS